MEILIIGILVALAVAAVVIPLVRPAPGTMDEATLDAEVDRYRKALRTESVCDQCLAANEPEAQYCANCGAPLTPEQEEAGT
jgi:ribosomal protein L40E